MAEVLWKNPDWTPGEAPKIPGSPATLDHSWPVRVRFAAIGLLCGFTANLGNALVTANLPQVQGNLGLTPVEGQWLLGAYVMTNCWGNLVLFKFRIQYGVRAFVQLGLLAYAAISILQIFVQNYETALIARGASGLAAAPLFAVTTLYFIQCAGGKNLPKGAMAGITMGQIVSPIAFLVVPRLNDIGEPGLQYTFEAGLALLTLALVVIFPLPYGTRVKAFEWQDAVSVALFAPGLAMIVAVIAQGRNQWWTDQPWIGIALAGGLVLVIAGFAWEHGRRNPLLFTRWLTTGELLFFMAGAFVIRFLTTEQQVGAVGFLRTVGMGPDQLAPLFLLVSACAVAGLVTVLLFANPKTAFWFILVAVLLILVGSLLDRDATPQDRPVDFYLSQAIIGYASALFIGPLLLTGILKVIKEGTQFVISLIVVFAFTQSVGLLLGGSLLSTFQLFRQHEASGAIVAGVNPTNPIVQQRLLEQSKVYSATIADPMLRNAEGTGQLGRSASLNATTVAYDEVFSLLAVTASAFLVVLLIRYALKARGIKKERES